MSHQSPDQRITSLNSSSPAKILPPLRDVIDHHGLRAKKSFGQNFLLDLNLTGKIARHAGIEGAHVIEIGPGPGGLTRALLDSGARKVTAIELDDRIIPVMHDLQAAYGPDRLNIIHGDALQVNYVDLINANAQEGAGAKTAIVANLPYNVATPLLVNWLYLLHNHPGCLQSMTLMFQKEVGQRITAQMGDKHYGRLAILSQFLCRAHILFDVPASAFTPPPKVTSSIVRLVVPKELDGAQSPADLPHIKTLEKVTAAAFGQRRKMLRTTLASYLPILDKLGIAPTLRAENVTLDQFISIAKLVDQQSD